jgi:hypothetical protein
MRRDFADIAGLAPAASLAALSCYLEAEPVQEDGGGIAVGVGLVNGGDNGVALVNPFALVQFQVRDDRGVPLSLPTRPPPMFVHTAGGEDWSLDGPPRIVDLRRNGRAEDPSQVGRRVWHVAGHEDCRVGFVLDRMLATGDADAEPIETAIPSGTYTVNCLTTLIHAERSDESRLLQSGEIEVRYGRDTS